MLKAETATTEVTNLKAEVTKLETEIKRLTKSTALPGSKPAGAVPPAKDFFSLSPEEQRKQIRSGLGG